MKISRKQNKGQPTAILSADWHLRADTPRCRIDDYISAMQNKVDFIISLAKEHQIPILIAGDLGHKSQWPNWLLEWTIKKFKDVHIICIPGQHDLPNHKLELTEQSGIGVLSAANVINLKKNSVSEWVSNGVDLYCYPYEQEIKHQKIISASPPNDKKNICMTHQMIIKDKEEWPDQKATQAKKLLRDFPEYNLILSGDNHQAFVVEYEGRLLVNPGSMMRNTTIQIDHQPRVYLWYKDTNEVEAVYLPIQQDVISVDHIIDKTEIDSRMASYIERLKTDVELDLSFEDNLKNHLNINNIESMVKNKIFKQFPENSKLRV